MVHSGDQQAVNFLPVTFVKLVFNHVRQMVDVSINLIRNLFEQSIDWRWCIRLILARNFIFILVFLFDKP